MQPIPDLNLAAKAAASQAIELMGGPVETARKVPAPSYQVVQSWKKSGVPPRHCRKVSALSGLSLRELRPHDWQHYWSEVEASAVPAQETGNA